MKDNKNYIKVLHHVDGDKFFVVTNNKTKELTQDKDIYKMFKILDNYNGKSISKFSEVYEDYDEIMKEFNKKKRVNRKKSKKISIGIISGVLVVSLIAGSFLYTESRKNNGNLTEQEIEVGIDSELSVIKKPYIANLSSDYEESIRVEEKSKSFYIPKFKYYSDNEHNVKINEFYYDFSGYNEKGQKVFNYQTIENAKKYKYLYNKYGLMYGIDPILLLLIAAQESDGIHDPELSGPAYGLMQIEGPWFGKEITVYNFSKKEYETVYIDPAKKTDVEYIVMYSAIIFRSGISGIEEKVKENIIPEDDALAFLTQEYNFGLPNINTTVSLPGYWLYNRDKVFDKNGNPVGNAQYIEELFCVAPEEQIFWYKTDAGKTKYFKMKNINDYVYSQAPSGHSL